MYVCMYVYIYRPVLVWMRTYILVQVQTKNTFTEPHACLTRFHCPVTQELTVTYKLF
jgi:hypothetical protein